MKYEVNRTELVWPGKYDEAGNRVVKTISKLPFQITERVNEARATRQERENQGATLFDVWNTSEDGNPSDPDWRNKLIWGDNELIMESLLENFTNSIDLVYIDPPFAVGSDFKLEVNIGDQELSKEASMIEEVAYRDTWGKGNDSYIPMIYARLQLMNQLMSANSFIVVHVDWHVSHYIRTILDEIFGADNFVNEIIWHYYNKYSAAKNAFPRAHDNLFVYKKGKPGNINETRELRDAPMKQLLRESVGGKLINKRDDDGNLMYQEVSDKKVDDVWRIPAMQPASNEWTGYNTQKHHDLLERIISAFSNPGDLVADFFVGSGTTAVVAERLNRRWIASDLGRFAIHTTRKRLLSVPDCKPFDVLNLGFYERQYWSNISFGDSDGSGETDLLEYVSFILKLYGASAISGGIQLHGRFANAYVHVGSVSSPVTIKEVEDCIEETLNLKGKDLHILGWEWEMGLIDTLTSFAKKKGVNLTAKQIPREVMEDEAVRKGQIKFFELSYLEAGFNRKSPLTYTCTLEDFVIPNPELIPDEVRGRIKNWSDFIDYWAVDWNFQNDTFMPSWMDFRTKQNRKLDLKTSEFEFEAKGTYKVMVKVVDIFGNDSTSIFDLDVK